MDIKLTALAVAILAGLAVPAVAERGHDGAGPGGPGMGPRPSFSDLDADGDGSLTTAELEAFGTSRFSGVDTDGNGEISADEMTAATMARMRERIATDSRVRIARLDTDGNGALSRAELQAGMKSGGMDRMFQRLDADKDGTVSAEEFAAVTAHPPMKDKWREMRGHGGDQPRHQDKTGN